MWHGTAPKTVNPINHLPAFNLPRMDPEHRLNRPYAGWVAAFRRAPSEGGTGAGVTRSRGPTCGDATVEPAMGASMPAPCASAGSDPQRGPTSALRRAPLGDVTPETDATPALDGAAPDSRTFASRKREPCSLLAGAPRAGRNVVTAFGER